MAIVVQHQAVAENQSSQKRTIPIADSSFLQEIEYDPGTLQLTVTMKSGAQYIHWYVYPATFDALIQAPSKGRAYAEMVKGKNPSTRIISKSVGKEVKKAFKTREKSHA